MASPAILIENDLVDPTKHLLHRLKIKTFSGDIGLQQILFENGAEAACFTFGGVDDLRTVGLGLLEELGCRTARFGEHPARIGIRFVLLAVPLLFGGLHVAEGRNHVLGRVSLVEVGANDVYAGVITIEGRLNEILEALGNHRPVPVEDRRKA